MSTASVLTLKEGIIPIIPSFNVGDLRMVKVEHRWRTNGNNPRDEYAKLRLPVIDDSAFFSLTPLLLTTRQAEVCIRNRPFYCACLSRLFGYTLPKSVAWKEYCIVYEANDIDGYLAFVNGAYITIIVKSRSITSSALTPLVGMGARRLEQKDSTLASSTFEIVLVLKP